MTREFTRLESLIRGLRSGFRSVRTAPPFALVVILTLALGIGAVSAIFSVLYEVLLRPPPYPNGERLAEVWESYSGQQLPVSWINFQNWRAANRSFEEMAGFENADLTSTGHGDARLMHAGVVTAAFFRLTGWRATQGRLFSEDDDRPGAVPVVVVTSEFCARILNGDVHAVGRMLTLNGRAYQIIGILPPALRFFTRPVDFYLPAGPRDGATIDRAEHGSMVVFGLLKPGVTLAAARADLDGIMRRLAVSDPGPEAAHRTSLAWFRDFGTKEIRPPLLMLLAAVVLVLLTACANVATLTLLRSARRVRETAIRIAIGAGRQRLSMELFGEHLAFAVLGGAVALVLAGLSLRILVFAGPPDIPRLWDVGINVPVLLFTAVITLATTLVAGLAPMSSAGRVDLTAALKGGSPATGSSRRGYRSRDVFVAAQIAIGLVLSFACGILLRSLILAENADPGFNARSVLALELQLPPSRYQAGSAVRQFYSRIVKRLRAEPGVVSVGLVDCPPSTGGCARGWYSITGMPPPPRNDVPLTLLTAVDPTYFETMRMRLLAGRNIQETDGEGRPAVAIVNQKLARRWWPQAPRMAVGHALKLGGPYLDGPTIEIVGVVSDAKQASLDAEPQAEFYLPFAQRPSPAMVVMIRTNGNPRLLVPTVRRDVQRTDADVPIQSLRPFEEWMQDTLARRRFSTLVLTVFAAVSFLLASVGVYGVLNHWIGTSQKQIAIRVALGAQRLQILRWAGWRVTRLLGFGIAVGVFGCAMVSRWLERLVFGVSAHSPQMLLMAIAAVIAVAALAAGGPLWRAVRIDPADPLRDN